MASPIRPMDLASGTTTSLRNESEAKRYSDREVETILDESHTQTALLVHREIETVRESIQCEDPVHSFLECFVFKRSDSRC